MLLVNYKENNLNLNKFFQFMMYLIYKKNRY